ncbi:hypothetical protein GCM10023340_40720 [Nocardioides marinquilinus]|uniref:Histidine kinase n=1 Tax=Nocardioides marinquilinus TaxID=1210400 RepID=A0ABP9Q1P9_9ACTN
MTWLVWAPANGVIALAYLAIGLVIVVPLARARRLRGNPLALATAAIFLTGAVHHGALATHLWGWPLVVWSVLSAVAACWYWSLRRSYRSLTIGPQLFDDVRRREQQALELNDTVLQSLVVAKLALDLDDPERVQRALDSSIAAASKMVTDLIGEAPASTLLRSAPAEVGAVLSTDAPVTP